MSEHESNKGTTAREFGSDVVNDWCAGCGDFGILRAMQRAFADLGLNRELIAVFGGIGCSGKAPYYLSTFGIHTLHGRVLSFATGAKLANPDLTVIAVGGDGDGLSIGAGQFVHSGRRNIDLTYILFNNGVYGLTKGQAAPTLRAGEKTRHMAGAANQKMLNPIALALVSGYGWIGRGYAYDLNQLTELLRQAIEYPGTALLEVLQPCPTYNDRHTKAWFEGEGLAGGAKRLYRLVEEGYSPIIDEQFSEQELQAKQAECLVKAVEWGDRIATGLFFEDQRVGKAGMADECLPAVAPAHQLPLQNELPLQRDMTQLLDELMVSRHDETQ